MDIVYLLVDAVGARRGMSMPEDVEHAKSAIADLRRDAERYQECERQVHSGPSGESSERTYTLYLKRSTHYRDRDAFRNDLDATIAAEKEKEKEKAGEKGA